MNVKKTDMIKSNDTGFLIFMKSKFPLYHQSNIFFRDLHYGVMEFLEKKKVTTTYSEGEQIAREIAVHFEKKNIFKKVNQQGWVLLYPDFVAKKVS